MSTPEEGRATQLRNIEARTGRSLDVWRSEMAASGKAKHGELRAWLIERHGVGYGDANRLAHEAKGPASSPVEPTDVLDEIYAGKKAHLRPVHEAVMAALAPWGEFEVSPKKGYVSLRRKKQFAMLGPKTNERAELGLNLKADVASARVIAQKPGGMCQYAVALTTHEEVDAEVVSVLRQAFDTAG